MTAENTQKEVDKEEIQQETEEATLQEENLSEESGSESTSGSENEEATVEKEEVKSEDATAKAIEEVNNKYLRLVAEFENFRRRTAKENLELVESANNRLIGNFCEVVENFERAFNQKTDEVKPEDFREGIRLIRDQFLGVLKQAGLEEINPENETFDPNLHEALMQQPHDEVAEGNVVTVFQKGFKVKNKVIKHAKVIVSSGPAA